MNMVSDARFANRKGANKGTHSCHSCSAWLSMTLWQVQAELQPGEFLFAFLDDVHVLSLPERTRKICDLWPRNCIPELEFAGKTRRWNRAAEIPEGSWVQRCGPLKG